MRVRFAILLVFLSTSFTFAGRPPATRDAMHSLPPTLTVNGDAEAPAKPDLAIVRIGAEVQAEKAQQAQDQVNQIMTRATEAVRGQGVAENDVQTSGLNLWPIYGTRRPRPVQQPQDEEQRLVGYRASNVLEIRVQEVAKVGPIIDAAINAGANRLESVSFALKDDIEPRKKALASAAKEARAKADALAEAMGVTIEGVEEIAEGGVQIYPPRPMRRMAGYAAAEAMADTPVQPGEVRVHASVTVTYRLAPAGE